MIKFGRFFSGHCISQSSKENQEEMGWRKGEAERETEKGIDLKELSRAIVRAGRWQVENP